MQARIAVSMNFEFQDVISEHKPFALCVAKLP